ncbi:MAG: redoxin domain-containing protein [Chitinophagales bacterium]
MALAKGTIAPNFTLFNTDKKQVSLADFKGKHAVIIHFFPAAFTGVCTEQLCHMRDNLSIYTGLNCVVLGVSVDMVFSLAVFREQQQYNFDLLSDFNKEMIQAYDVYLQDFAFGMKGVAKRAAYVIDKEGVIVYSEETANPGVLPDFAAIKAAAEILK